MPEPRDGVTDSFFSPLARSIEKEAFRHNYILKYTFTAFDINHPHTFRLISDHDVDGVAVLGRCDKQLLKFLKQYFKCVVYAGLNNLDAKYDQIICDSYEASLYAMEHLCSLGHKNIAYIGETQWGNRYRGYCSALAAHRLPLKSGYVVNVMLSSEGGYRGAKKLFGRNTEISAIFCPNDITAMGAIKAVNEHGYSIPRDISVISIDEIDTAQYLRPMLTTIHIPVEEMGPMAAKTLIDRIEGGHKLPLKVSFPFYIAKRESCGPLKLWPLKYNCAGWQECVCKKRGGSLSHFQYPFQRIIKEHLIREAEIISAVPKLLENIGEEQLNHKLITEYKAPIADNEAPIFLTTIGKSRRYGLT